jgi:Cu(I)/Ag(I) efflux system membrane fusion protein
MTRRAFAGTVIALTVVIAAIVWWSLRVGNRASETTPDGVPASADTAAIEYYTCTMHPSVRETKPGRCPICNMDLVPVRSAVPADTVGVDLTFSVSPAKQQLIGVTFATVEHKDLHHVIRAYGRVSPDETRAADVNLRVGGWIEELHVDFTGRAVKKGEPLFTLYSPELLAAQSEYLVALRAARGEGSMQEGASLVESARERLRLWQVTDEQIRALETTGEASANVTIVSPTTGVVVEKIAVKGMRVEPGMTLYKIVDLTRVWINADVYEFDLPLVHVGQEADVTVPTVPPQQRRGRIEYVDPYLDAQTRTARARIELANTDGRLKPEMFVDVGIHVELGERLVVPVSAVLRTGERQIVFVDQGGGIFEVRLVTLGASSEEVVEVVQGLHEGERVVSSANFLIDAESNVQGVLRRMEGSSAPETPATHRH